MKIFLILSFLSFNSLLYSQTYKQINLGGSFLGIDSPNNHGYRFSIGLTKTLNNNRLEVSSTLSFMNWKVNNWKEISGINLIDIRTRGFADFDFSFAPIKYKNNYFRLGVGPTLMVLHDNRVSRVKTTIEYDLNTKSNYLKYTSHETTLRNTILIGVNTFAGFTFAINPKLNLNSNFGLTYIDRSIIPLINCGIGYKL
jgi:hypothetical protein